MKDINELEKLVNYYANTKVSVKGELGDHGQFKGHLVGSSTDEISEFLTYIAYTRGREFDNVGIRYHTQSPPSFRCYIEFNSNEIDIEKGYLNTECTNCGKSTKYEMNSAGHKADCPNCGEIIIVGFKYHEEYDENVIDEEIIPLDPQINISNVLFNSSDHKRYNSGIWSGYDNKGSIRIIEIKPDNEFKNSYIVTVYNPYETHPEWKDNLSLSPKRMRIISSDKNQITLKGYGNDPMLSNREPQTQRNYGITLHLHGEEIQYISYYFHDRNVRIDYFK